MRLVFHFLFLLTMAPQAEAKSFKELGELLRSSEWSQFLNLLHPCQKQNPDLYTPVELIRIDQMPLQELSTIVQIYASDEEKARSEAKAYYQLSCQANDDLATYFGKIEKDSQNILLGSHKENLEFIPKELRKGLSPLDPLFFESHELGKKVSKDLKLLGLENKISSARIDLKNNLIRFEGSPNITESPQELYQIQFQNYVDRKIKFRSVSLADRRPTSKDLILPSINFLGAVFDPRKSRKRPLGIYPQAGDLWLEENGSAHYHGDGHAH